MNVNGKSLPSVSLVALVAVAAGFIIGSLNPHTPQPAVLSIDSRPQASLETGQTRVVADPSIAPDLSAAALHDMHEYAVRHLGVFEEDLQSFDVSKDWSPSWQLRWMDVHEGTDTVRIYHVTDTQNARHRFTTTWVGGQALWEPAY